MVELFANSGDPDQTPHSSASDLGLHCLPVTHLGVSNFHWVNAKRCIVISKCCHCYSVSTSLSASKLEPMF